MKFQRVDLLWHSWMVHSSLAELGGKASLDLQTFVLDMRVRNRCYRFYPRFLLRSRDQLVFADRPVSEIEGFAGWLPYVNKRWPIGSGKFAFKQFCVDEHLPTPRFWRRPSAEMRAFLIKHDASSCGRGIRGPFAHFDSTDARQALQPGEYYEEFIAGRTVKAWFWEDRLVSLESRPMPVIVGDGASTVRDLLEQNKRPGVRFNWERFKDLASYQGLQLDAVLPKGQARLADFHFGSPLNQGAFDTMPTLERHRHFPFVDQLARLGGIFWNGIPEDVRPATLYTVDAIAGDDGRVVLLEMNCNPLVHTEVYPFMLERLFGKRSAPLAPTALPFRPAGGRAMPLPGSLTRFIA